MLLAQNKLQEFIQKEQLFTPNEHILLAVSGGKDSVLMAHLFAHCGFNFAIAHCNFNLRGQEAQRDQEFVKNLAKQLNVAFYLANFNTQAYAEEHQISIQMAARELRYAFFEDIRLENNFDKIAVAHHQNDVIETVLINLVRGTGISGLHGIKAKRENIIRPLLCFTADEINHIVQEHNISFVEDSSNLSNKYFRNKIRLDVVPTLKELNPSLEKTFEKNIAYFNQLEEFLAIQVSSLFKQLFIPIANGYKIEIAKINALNPLQLLLFEILKPFGFNLTSIQDLIKALGKPNGQQFYSDDYVALLDRESLIINKLSDSGDFNIQIEEEEMEMQNHLFKLRSSVLQHPLTDFKSTANVAYINSNLLVYPLTVRNWKTGDSFKPFGMNGMKKLSNFFIQLKINNLEKAKTPILVNGDGKIIWVCGLRTDDRFKVTLKTNKIIIFTLENV
jgi:tRNA(Ile)-lysidine synthase